GWSVEKTHADDRETFHRLREFRGYGRPLLVSINRKSFLKTIAGRSTEEALPVSLAESNMVWAGVAQSTPTRVPLRRPVDRVVYTRA
ncbi:hypothetical protein DJ71_05790, partial [Halorubrum sp. E3]